MHYSVSPYLKDVNLHKYSWVKLCKGYANKYIGGNPCVMKSYSKLLLTYTDLALTQGEKLTLTAVNQLISATRTDTSLTKRGTGLQAAGDRITQTATQFLSHWAEAVSRACSDILTPSSIFAQKRYRRQSTRGCERDRERLRRERDGEEIERRCTALAGQDVRARLELKAQACYQIEPFPAL